MGFCFPRLLAWQVGDRFKLVNVCRAFRNFYGGFPFRLYCVRVGGGQKKSTGMGNSVNGCVFESERKDNSL